MRCSALLLLFCLAAGAQQASFEGIAVNQATGQPMSGVHVMLYASSAYGIGEVYGAISNRDGRFSMASVAPGAYTLLPDRAGFVHMVKAATGGPPARITLKGGERVADYRLEMAPRAVIYGRVVNEYGDPTPNMPVEVSPVSPDAPLATINGGRRVMTDDRGEFRISGGPGKFYIKATPGTGGSQATEIRTDGTTRAHYGPTWYPSVPSADRASVVEAVAGRDVSGIEIRLLRQRGVGIFGVVTGMPAGEGSSVLIQLQSGDSPNRMTSTRGVGAQPDGRFTFGYLPSAYYRVSAIWDDPPKRSQSVDISPDGPETVDVRLVLAPGGEMTGALEIAGDAPGAAAAQRTVKLEPVGLSGSAPSGTVDRDGSFRIASVPAGLYRVVAQPLPENAYLKTVQLDGATAAADEIDLTRGAQGSRLQIVVSRNGAQLSGAVLDKDGQPLAYGTALVLLAPDVDHISPELEGLIKAGGRYSFKGIRPGKYLVFAVGVPTSNPDFKKLAAGAEQVEFKEGDRIAKDLKVVLKEDADAKK